MDNFQMQPVNVQVNKPGVNAFGIVGMILGILALLLSCIAVLGLILGIMGLTISVCGFIPKNKGRGMTITGTVLNSIAVIISFIILIITSFNETKDDYTKIVSSIQNSPTQETKQATSNTESEFPIGSVVETRTSIITFVSCEDYISDNEFLLPKEGYKYITAKFEFENIGETDIHVSFLDFECYADGYAAEQSYTNSDNELSATISSGRKAKGYITYEVPEDAKEIVFEYSPNLFSSKKIKFIAE